MDARFDREILAHLPVAVSIMAGTNDSADPTPLAAYEASLRAMIARAQGIGTRVTLCTPPVARGAAWAALPNYVTVIRAVAADTPGVVLFDVYAHFSTLTPAQLDPLYDDQVHLNAAGQQVIANLAAQSGNATAFTATVMA